MCFFPTDPPLPRAFRCPDGTYIPSYYICDGIGNCEDSSDELNCGESLVNFLVSYSSESQVHT